MFFAEHVCEFHLCVQWSCSMEFVFLSWTFVQFCPKLEDLVMQKILVRRKVSPSHLKGDNVVFPIHVFYKIVSKSRGEPKSDDNFPSSLVMPRQNASRTFSHPPCEVTSQ